MRLKFTGWQGKRIVGDLVWDARNQFVCEVADAETIIALLTEPHSAFCIAGDDPLWQAACDLVENTQDAKKILYALLEMGVGGLGDMATWAAADHSMLHERGSLDEIQIARLVQRAQEHVAARTVEEAQ